MQFHQVDVGRRQATLRIGLVGRDARQPGLAQRAVLAARQLRGAHLHRPCTRGRRQVGQAGLGAQQRGGCAVAHGRAHRSRQRPAHGAVGQHLVGRHVEAVLRLGVQAAMVVVLGRADGDLPLRGAVGLHVPGGLHGVGVHVQRAAGAGLERLAGFLPGAGVVVAPALRLQLVDAGGEDGRHSRRVVGADELLDAQRQAHLRLARQHVLPRAVEGEGRGGAAAFDVDHRHALGEQPLLHQRREAHLPADAALPPLAQAAVAEPGLLDQRCVATGQAGVGQHLGVGLAHQVVEALVGVLAERRARGADDVDVIHGVSPGPKMRAIVWQRGCASLSWSARPQTRM